MNFFSIDKKKQLKRYHRRAHHAGSWYSHEPKNLDHTLSKFLSESDTHSRNCGEGDDGAKNVPRGIIAPHAGYSYSGSTAAYAYKALRESFLKLAACGDKNTASSTTSNTTDNDASKRTTEATILVLHPSHHVYLDGCAISGASMVETPLKNLEVDEELRIDLLQAGTFSQMDQKTDEEEHSGEMQYPYIAKAILDAETQLNTADNYQSISPSSSPRKHELKVKVLPIMIGALSSSKLKYFGKILAPFIARPHVFTIISSDFCHWGKRFGYTPIPPPNSTEEIHQYIERIDHLGMKHISMQEPGAFAIYMREHKNTICGRYPIQVYMNAMKENQKAGVEALDVQFVKYAQSSQVRSQVESSVSYASAVSRKV